MQFLWRKITEIARKYNIIAAGDTACGFANTAMILADKGMIPKVLATVVRAASIPRSLVAYQEGPTGPSKDCAYEGPFLKAITGIPISMEGKTSACAHLSKLGNISAAFADLWSNESVQNVRLLSTFAPTVYLEQLIYDCRLHNVAAKQGKKSALQLRDWLIESDAGKDPQAYIFKPDNIIRIAQCIVGQSDPLKMTISAINETLAILENAADKNDLKLSDTEKRWLTMLQNQLELVPADESELYASINSGEYKNKYQLTEYGFN
jgi:methanol--5-hydroxybenzimidazolylcobamide Co-methyltransferase